MNEIRYIAMKQFCTFHNVEHQVVLEVAEYGLVDFEKRPDDYYLPEEAISTLERIIRLRIDLGINMPGIETIMHMRQRMLRMQDELNDLRRQLSEYARTYEDEEPEERGFEM